MPNKITPAIVAILFFIIAFYILWNATREEIKGINNKILNLRNLQATNIELQIRIEKLEKSAGEINEALKENKKESSDNDSWKRLTIKFDHNKHKINELEKSNTFEMLESLNFKIQRIVIRGYTDTTGSNIYNIILSAKRAFYVKKLIAEELKSAGKSQPPLIDIEFFGEEELRTPTDENTREPLNRVVEVYFH